MHDTHALILAILVDTLMQTTNLKESQQYSCLLSHSLASKEPVQHFFTSLTLHSVNLYSKAHTNVKSLHSLCKSWMRISGY